MHKAEWRERQPDCERVRQNTNVRPVIRFSPFACCISAPVWYRVWVTSRWHLQSLSLEVWASMSVSKCNGRECSESSWVIVYIMGMHHYITAVHYSPEFVCFSVWPLLGWSALNASMNYFYAKKTKTTTNKISLIFLFWAVVDRYIDRRKLGVRVK